MPTQQRQPSHVTTVELVRMQDEVRLATQRLNSTTRTLEHALAKKSRHPLFSTTTPPHSTKRVFRARGA